MRCLQSENEALHPKRKKIKRTRACLPQPRPSAGPAPLSQPPYCLPARPTPPPCPAPQLLSPPSPPAADISAKPPAKPPAGGYFLRLCHWLAPRYLLMHLILHPRIPWAVRPAAREVVHHCLPFMASVPWLDRCFSASLFILCPSIKAQLRVFLYLLYDLWYFDCIRQAGSDLETQTQCRLAGAPASASAPFLIRVPAWAWHGRAPFFSFFGRSSAI
jgi:hypothetical protein